MAWAPDYVTVEEARAYRRIPDMADDVQIGQAITAASRAIDDACNRQFGKVAAPELRTYTAQWSRSRCEYFVLIDDLPTATGLLVEEQATDGTWSEVTDYRLGPPNAAAMGYPWRGIYAETLSTAADAVRITGVWGWVDVPGAIKAATLLQVSRFLARRDSPFGVAGSPDTGGELRLLARVDPDVAVAVARYRRAKVVTG